MKEGTRIVVALGAAVIGGVAISASGSATALNAADAIAPIGTLWVNAIRMTVIPLIVSLLITGVASTADVASIGRLGGRTLLVFVLLLACVAAVVVPLAPSLFALLPFPSGGGAHPALPRARPKRRASSRERRGRRSVGGSRRSFRRIRSPRRRTATWCR